MATNKGVLKTGIRNIPTDGDWNKVDYYFHYSLDEKDRSKLLKNYIKNNYSKEDYSAAMLNAEWNFSAYGSIVAACYWMNNGYEFPEKYKDLGDKVKEYIDTLVAKGKGIQRTKAALSEEKNKKVYTPQQRLAMKINNTIMRDIDQLEEEWINDEGTCLDIVAAFRIHELKGMAVGPVIEYLKRLLPEYQDAHNGACKDAKAAYGHLGKRELSRRIKCVNKMITDLEQFKDNQKAKRKKRTK